MQHRVKHRSLPVGAEGYCPESVGLPDATPTGCMGVLKLIAVELQFIFLSAPSKNIGRKKASDGFSDNVTDRFDPPCPSFSRPTDYPLPHGLSDQLLG